MLLFFLSLVSRGHSVLLCMGKSDRENKPKYNHFFINQKLSPSFCPPGYFGRYDRSIPVNIPKLEVSLDEFISSLFIPEAENELVSGCYVS